MGDLLPRSQSLSVCSGGELAADATGRTSDGAAIASPARCVRCYSVSTAWMYYGYEIKNKYIFPLITVKSHAQPQCIETSCHAGQHNE